MLGYTSVMVLLMLACNLWFGQAAGVASVLVFSLYGIPHAAGYHSAHSQTAG